MTYSNRFLNLLEAKTDDELFEIIDNPTDNLSDQHFYESAIDVALQRELLTEYQAQELKAGNLTVLQYNPEIVELEPKAYDSSNRGGSLFFNPKRSLVSTGLIAIGLGLLILLLSHTRYGMHFHDNPYYRYPRLIVAYGAVAVGFVIFVIGVFKRFFKH